MKNEQIYTGNVLGYPVRASVVQLDAGYHILLTGGDSTHVGAVSFAAPGEEIRSMERSGHRDATISSRWAKCLSEAWDAPVCVCCGIHYENVNRTQIREIVKETDRLLKTLRILCHNREKN